jgi:spore maturation protein CgeB
LISDWNHGNAHFLRGIATELISRGHRVNIYEPRGAWSIENLLNEYGTQPLSLFHSRFPQLTVTRYEPASIDLDKELDASDLVLVHEWNTPELVRAVGERRLRMRNFVALFHDTHHRALTDPAGINVLDLRNFDGVLAFGEALKAVYLERSWANNVFVWHEGADTRIFRPFPEIEKTDDLVWIGNWGDEERSEEIRQFILEPTRALGLNASIYGVRYPESAVHEILAAGINFCGWLPNFEVPRQFARFRATVHVPRRPYVGALSGIPTIRVFEALSCAIPLMSGPWEDSEHLFGQDDFLIARDGPDVQRKLRILLLDHAMATEMSAAGRRTILLHHTCAHRVDELLRIYDNLAGNACTASQTDA